jgi:hypothetical protein
MAVKAQSGIIKQKRGTKKQSVAAMAAHRKAA